MPPDFTFAVATAADYWLGCKIERVRAALEAETPSLTRQQWFRIRKAALL